MNMKTQERVNIKSGERWFLIMEKVRYRAFWYPVQCFGYNTFTYENSRTKSFSSIKNPSDIGLGNNDFYAPIAFTTKSGITEHIPKIIFNILLVTFCDIYINKVDITNIIK